MKACFAITFVDASSAQCERVFRTKCFAPVKEATDPSQSAAMCLNYLDDSVGKATMLTVGTLVTLRVMLHPIRVMDQILHREKYEKE